MRRFNSILFIVVTVVFCVFAYLSFSMAFARDEGKIGDSTFRNLLADAFNIMRFPTHIIFKRLTHRPFYFCIGLVINCMVYSLLLERLVYVFLMPKDEKEHEGQDEIMDI